MRLHPVSLGKRMIHQCNISLLMDFCLQLILPIMPLANTPQKQESISKAVHPCTSKNIVFQVMNDFIDRKKFSTLDLNRIWQ